jgi:adenine-specific DNA-methyltransferase
MITRWARSLGLAETSLFASDGPDDGDDHKLLLDGVRGSFAISQVSGADAHLDPRSWAWSSGVLHHITATHDQVILRRWDKTGQDRYSLTSVNENLDRFYDHVFHTHAEITRNIAAHAIDAFRRLRSLFDEEHQGEALSVFLLLLAAMLESVDEDILERADKVMDKYDVPPDARHAIGRLTKEFAAHLITSFRRPTIARATELETFPSLMVRHAGATLFQEAHFELGRRGAIDLWGVPEAAHVTISASSGVHFTPPGLARVIVEQSFEAHGPLPDQITILDPACGSGSILHEAIRALKDRNYAGRVRIIGFDQSASAVAMARFLISAAKLDWPTLGIVETRIECRDSLNEEEWPRANFIMMNPPFVSLRWLDDAQRKSMHRILGKHARGRPDLSMAFIERGVSNLKDNGVMGTLLPAGVLSMTYAQHWRRHLLDEGSVSFLAVFSEVGLFKMATVETGCIVLRKGTLENGDFYKALWVGEKRDATQAALRYLRRTTGAMLSSNEASPWTLSELPARQLIESPTWRPRPATLERRLSDIKSRVPTSVRDIFDVKQGAHPAPRDAFVIDASVLGDLPESEHRWFRRVVENQNIRSGRIHQGQFVFYARSSHLPDITDEDELRYYCPHFSKYLERFRPELSARKRRGERWWELSEDRQWLRDSKKKIVSAYFGQRGSFAYDISGDHVIIQGYGWLPSWRLEPGIEDDELFFAYLALFNSLLFSELLSAYCPTVGGGQFNLSKRFSKWVPLPDLLAWAGSNSGSASELRDLSRIGEIIHQDGLAAAPQARAEDLVRLFYNI